MTELTLFFFGHFKKNSVKDRKSPKKSNFYTYWCFIYERISALDWSGDAFANEKSFLIKTYMLVALAVPHTGHNLNTGNEMQTSCSQQNRIKVFFKKGELCLRKPCMSKI